MQSYFDLFMVFLFSFFRIFPINKRKIVISSYLGRGYGDNPKYIVEELLKRGEKYDIVWLTKEKDNVFPAGVRAVEYRSVRAVFELCTAKIWIDNRRKPPYVRKRPNQCYIMTWHGYMAIKKLEKDVENSLEPRYVEMAKRDSKMIDYFVSGSRWETNLIQSAFWYDGKILQTGYPRSDILIRNSEQYYQTIRRIFNLSPNDKILLYAPTFRQQKNEESLHVYKLDWQAALTALHKRFGGNWVGMIRLHPNVANLADKLNIPDCVINVTAYEDMQALITACDCMITDYSSSIMDAGVAGKMGFIFATDYAEYEKDRDVYFNIKKDMPFSFAESNEQLTENIVSFDSERYYSGLRSFLKDVYGVYDSGNASQEICDLIDNVTSQ